MLRRNKNLNIENPPREAKSPAGEACLGLEGLRRRVLAWPHRVSRFSDESYHSDA
jgi:hypothetical protein